MLSALVLRWWSCPVALWAFRCAVVISSRTWMSSPELTLYRSCVQGHVLILWMSRVVIVFTTPRIVFFYYFNKSQDRRPPKSRSMGVQPDQIPDINPVLVQCWTSVSDAGPTLHQQWVNMSCCWAALAPLLSIMFMILCNNQPTSPDNCSCYVRCCPSEICFALYVLNVLNNLPYYNDPVHLRWRFPVMSVSQSDQVWQGH